MSMVGSSSRRVEDGLAFEERGSWNDVPPSPTPLRRRFGRLVNLALDLTRSCSTFCSRFPFLCLPCLPCLPSLNSELITQLTHHVPHRPWCWIPTRLPSGAPSTTNGILVIATEYGWFWLSSLVCFLCYGYVVYYWLREGGRRGDGDVVRSAVRMAW